VSGVRRQVGARQQLDADAAPLTRDGFSEEVLNLYESSHPQLLQQQIDRLLPQC
jgi:hypothetical protein